MKQLSIVVGTYNRRDQIQACIESIARETSVSHVVYVTDAGSTDGTIEYLETVRSESVVPILVGRRIGQAAAYNQVFDMVETPFVCWLSDDNVVVDRGLDTAVAALQGDDNRLGMIGLKTRDLQGPFVAAPYIGGISSMGILNVNQGVLRTEALREAGGFSERFRDYGIDPDLTAKILYLGYDIAFTRLVALHHFRNWNTDPSSEDHAKLKALQKQYQRLYDLKYGGPACPTGFWLAKKTLWRSLQKLFPKTFDPNTKASFLGVRSRDLNNIFSGRFISILDPFRTQGKPYHLVQRMEASGGSLCLPADPPPQDTELVHTR